MDFLSKVKDAILGGGGESPEQWTSPSDQPKDDQELATYIKSFVEEVRTQATRISHEGIWMTNIAYLLGFDSVFYDPAQRQFRPSGSSATGGQSYIKRNRVHSNLLLPGAQNRLARMLKSPPRYDVRPNSMEEEDKDSAQLGVEVINSYWDKEDVNRKRIDLGMWVQQCGHSYIGVCWDDQKGEALVDPATGEITGYEGDIRIDVVPALECFPDPLAKTFGECTKFARAKVRKLDYFRTHYPERGHLVKEEGAWLLSVQYEMRINTLNSVGPASSGTAEQMKNAAIEVSYYEARSKKYPNGRHVIMANGVLLKNDELPAGEIPYAKFDDVIIGGKYYSESVITHCRPLQDQYNRNLVKTSDWTNKMLTGKYLTPRGAGLIQEAPNDQSGEVLEYDHQPGQPEPKALQMPTIPEYAYKERDTIKRDLYDIMGLSEVSRGQLPSASIPAMGIQLLLEQDETRMGIETEAQEHAWARVGMLILKYVDRYCITNRKLKIRSKSGTYDIRQYTGKDLNRNFDVTVIRGSTVPNSKVIHRQEILNIYSQGLLGDPQDPAVRDKVLGMLQYGEVGETWESQHLVKMQIQRDIEMIEQGMAPVVDEKDNHIMHLMKKEDYRISEKGVALPPENYELLQQNMAQHAQFATQQMDPRLASPPDPGPPPPPPEVTGVLQAAHESRMNPLGAPAVPPGQAGAPAGAA